MKFLPRVRKLVFQTDNPLMIYIMFQVETIHLQKNSGNGFFQFFRQKQKENPGWSALSLLELVEVCSWKKNASFLYTLTCSALWHGRGWIGARRYELGQDVIEAGGGGGVPHVHRTRTCFQGVTSRLYWKCQCYLQDSSGLGHVQRQLSRDSGGHVGVSSATSWLCWPSASILPT